MRLNLHRLESLELSLRESPYLVAEKLDVRDPGGAHRGVSALDLLGPNLERHRVPVVE
jgi:hypothetical protein